MGVIRRVNFVKGAPDTGAPPARGPWAGESGAPCQTRLRRD